METLKPPLRSWSTVWVPTKPEPPVTRMVFSWEEADAGAIGDWCGTETRLRTAFSSRLRLDSTSLNKSFRNIYYAVSSGLS